MAVFNFLYDFCWVGIEHYMIYSVSLLIFFPLKFVYFNFILLVSLNTFLDESDKNKD